MGASSPTEIAEGMLKIFNTRKQSGPEIFARSAVDGFMSIPEDLWMLTKDFLDSDHRWRNQTDKIRLLTLIKKGLTSEDVRRLINTVIKRYLSGLSEEQSKELLLKIGGSQVGGVAFKMIFVNELIALFVSKIVPRFLVSAGITGVLSVGASISRSVYTSYDLLKLNKDVYNELRGAGDLDLLYFLVEDNVKPFIEAINFQQSHGAIDQDIFNRFLTGVPVFNKAIRYIGVYLMLLMSFMLFFTVLGYYLFVFDWSVSFFDVMINAALLIFSVAASIAIYYFAEKVKSRL